jgi:HEPN domain-containing protein
MEKNYVNNSIVKRFDELISEGKRLWDEFKSNGDGIIWDIVSFTQWSTSCLNLLDKLSISSNRFVRQFEIWVIGGPGQKINIGAALGVLQSAKNEYLSGMAVDYHLSVSSSVFSGILDEASYLLDKGYLRAAAVLIGAALEEGLKTIARANSIEIGERETLSPVIDKLKKSDIQVLTEFEAKNLQAIAKMRNDAAHGGDFDYNKNQVNESFLKVEETIQRLFKM